MVVCTRSVLIKTVQYYAVLLFSFTLPISQHVMASSGEPISNKNRALLEKAQQEFTLKDYKKAYELSAKVLADKPNQFEAQFIRAQSLSHMGKINEAVDLYKVLLKSNPHQPEIHNNLATLYAQQGHLELARQTLENGIGTSEQYKTLYENLSAIYVEMARGAYSKALKLGVQAKAVELKALQVAAIPEPTVAAIDTNKSNKQMDNTQVAVATVTNNAGNKSPVINTDKVAKNDSALVIVKTPAPVQQVASPVIKTEDNKDKVEAKPEINKKSAASSNEKIIPKPAVTIDQEQVITALQGWAAAWSAQSVDLYLSFYDKDFKPSNLSREVWAVQRRIRISKPHWVSVRLQDFMVKPQQQEQAVVQLVQDYRADNYQDKTKKEFLMKHTIDGWRIVSENSLAVIK